MMSLCRWLCVAGLALCVSCSDGGGAAGAGNPDPADSSGSGAGGATRSPADVLADNLDGLTLFEFYGTSYRALVVRTPESVLWDSIQSIVPLEDASLNNLSEPYLSRTDDMYQVVLDKLETYDRAALSPEARIDYDVYRWFLQDHLEAAGYRYYQFIATYFLTGVHHDTLQFFTDIHPMETPQDARDYVTRLSGVKAKFEQVSDYLVRERDMGVVEPGLTMQLALNQASALLDRPVTSNPYYTAFQSKLSDIAGLSSSERDGLLADARAQVESSVIPGYRTLQQTLTSLRSIAPDTIGVGQYPGGATYYAFALRHHTTTDMTADEINQLGLEALDRVHAEMRVIFDQLGYPENETLQQLYARVASDGGIVQASDAKATFESYIDFADQRLDQAFDLFPPDPVVVAPDPYGGYYVGPSFDGNRPGTFYAGTGFNQPRYMMPTLTFHETIPGHHLQISLALNREGPAFRKLVSVTAFIEGWGLYAEGLAYDLGWYDDDPYGNLGRLQYEALRAARLVIDTGIHDRGWSYNQAVQFNVNNVGTSLGSSQEAVRRYSVWPGQATAYMVGMLKILEARQRVDDALGADFDLKEFHRVLLKAGAVPLEVMDRIVDDYIAMESGTT